MKLTSVIGDHWNGDKTISRFNLSEKPRRKITVDAVLQWW